MNRKINFTGYVTFSVIGAFSEDFLSELIESGINVTNVHNKNNILYADIKRTDYLYASKVAKKYRVRIKIYKRYGLYFKINRMKRHSGIVLGVIASVLMIMILQQYVWKIEINSNNSASDKLILEIIENDGIGLGSDIGDIDTDALALKIKHTLKETSWVGVEKIGSKLIISLSKSDNFERAEIPLNTPCNIIAGKTGVITETEVYSGTLLYPVGSGVSEGNIIVSGIVNDGADNILLSHANAKIIAEFKETVEIRQEYTTLEYQKTGENLTEKELMLFGFVIPLTDKVDNTENYTCEEQIKNCTFANLNLPFKIKTNIYTPLEQITVTRKCEDAERLVEQKFNIYCDNFFSGYQIIDVEKSIKRDEKGIALIAEVTLKGNIAVQQEILNKNVDSNNT